MKLKHLALIAALFTTSAFAAGGSYQLRSDCTLKKYEDGGWKAADASILDHEKISPTAPKSGTVRFKIGGTWYSTGESCLSSKSDQDMPPVDLEPGSSSSQSGGLKFMITGLAGGFLGLSDNNNGGQFAFGGRLGLGITNGFSIGAQFTSSSKSEGGVSLTYSELTLIPTFHFGGFYIGPQAGLGWRSASVSSVSVSGTAFEFGAATGFQFEIMDQLLIGPEVQFTQMGSASILGVDTGAEELLKVFLAITGRF
jgi:hypothetical protein